jgi:hypothetical protein
MDIEEDLREYTDSQYKKKHIKLNSLIITGEEAMELNLALHCQLGNIDAMLRNCKDKQLEEQLEHQHQVVWFLSMKIADAMKVIPNYKKYLKECQNKKKKDC